MSYVEISALQKMRSGIIFFLVAWALTWVGAIWAIVVLTSLPFSNLTSMDGLLGVFTAVVGAVILIIIGGIIALIGLFSRFIPGVRDLANANPKFSTASTLIRIGYIWGLILLIIGLILAIFIIGIPILLVGAILLLIGLIGTIVLCFKLKDVYQNSLYLVAGIFFILYIFITMSRILSVFTAIPEIIGWILIYIALGDTIRKLQTQATQE
ncbi:MAG: DUF973 family protein, partial [Zestosphaera sp.]